MPPRSNLRGSEVVKKVVMKMVRRMVMKMVRRMVMKMVIAGLHLTLQEEGPRHYIKDNYESSANHWK